jgi:hypothetical protein
MSEAMNAERISAKAEQPARPVTTPPKAVRPPVVPSLSNLPGIPPAAANRVAELQVSAHLMTLESGLFCVFQMPGSPTPDPITSLPGVRITPAPGIAGRPEAVSVSTFREDGWLNGTAALVRVTDGSAQILVTIYQDKGQDAAPRLQVLRLSGEPTAPADRTAQAAVASAAEVSPIAASATDATTPKPGSPPAIPNPEVMAHVQRMGDVTCDLGDWLGIKGSRQWVEGFGLAPNNGIALSDIEYQAVLGRNWLSPWVEGGKYCGSRGMALPLLGLKVRLKGEAAKTFECNYSGTFIDGSAAGPVNGGEACEAESLAALEAFQIVIRPRNGKPVSVRTGDKRTTGKLSSSIPLPAEASPNGGMPGLPSKPANRTRAKPQ